MKRKLIPTKRPKKPIEIVSSSTLASPVSLFTPQRKLIFSRRRHRYSRKHVAIPTQMTRTSPFHILSKRTTRDRFVKERTFENPWGKWTMKGELLNISDLKVTLAVCMLIYNERWKKPRSRILTTQYQLCKILGIKPTSQSYKLIWESLERLAETTVNFEDSRYQMVGSLLWVERDKKTNRIVIRTNSFFDKMFALEFITRFNHDFFLSIKGDVAKFLYVFLQSHTVLYTGGWYRIGIIKLCQALNIETENIPLSRLRSTIRKAIASLVNEKYLTISSCIHTNDVVWFQQPYKGKKLLRY